jgi:hypothetical protein
MGFGTIPTLIYSGRKAITYMKAYGFKVRALNIVYFEGLDTDLKTVNNDRIDQWNDVRAIISNKGEVLLCCAATTEPGWFYRNNPLNDGGAAQLAFGQYLDCWQIGDHRGQEALVQCGDLKLYRDKNEDGSRKGDAIDIGSDFGLNQHTTSNAPDQVGRWSAGCLVGKYPDTHNDKFMPICRAMGLETFDTTLIDGSLFALWDEDSDLEQMCKVKGVTSLA